jgi:phosphoadenosine phosphosulfate reductase
VLLRSSDLAPASAALAALAPIEILRLVAETFGRRAAILSSMQRAGTALCHMADRAGLQMDVVFVDTGVLHPETLATRDRLAATHPNLRVRTLAPARSFLEQTRELGLLYVTKEGQERCCELRKSDPLLTVRGEYDVLIGALRRDEGGRRSLVGPIEIDRAFGALRVHPFAYFARAELDAYCAEHEDVVVNPLHRLGFATIGCFPCTTPVRPDEDERAGRWRHLADVAYCGINPTDVSAESGGAEVSDSCARFLERAAALGTPR